MIPLLLGGRRQGGGRSRSKTVLLDLDHLASSETLKPVRHVHALRKSGVGRLKLLSLLSRPAPVVYRGGSLVEATSSKVRA